MILVLAGGVGAAKYLAGLKRAVDEADITVISNTGDDALIHSLHVSPDIDSVIYTLGNISNPETGWGIKDDTWNVMNALNRLGGDSWFNLGDKDIATHFYRTDRLNAGATLSEVTSELALCYNVKATIIPMSDSKVSTKIITAEDGELDFQDYFVKYKTKKAVTDIVYSGSEFAAPIKDVDKLFDQASAIVIAPSNPFLSIGPILAILPYKKLLEKRRDKVICISPIVGGRSLKGPLKDIMCSLGIEPTVFSIAKYYESLASKIVIDFRDESYVGNIKSLSMTPILCDSVMTDAQKAEGLARISIEGIL